jgi:predicted TIM-barrel fold metal-dependent hydrolase
MSDLIALEEHFALRDTLADSAPYAVSGGWSDLERRLLDLGEIRLAEMDRHGVKLAVLSLNSPGVQAIRRTAAAVDAARKANDVLANAVAKHTGRLHGFAALPMQDPDAAAVELRRAVVQLGLLGVLVNGFSEVEREAGVVYYDELDYLPFWAEVERLGVPFYLHPRDPLLTREPILRQHPWLQGSAWAFGMETATHALRLMTSGVFDRCPNLQLILGHLGEGLPFHAWRIDHRMSRSPRGVPAMRTVTDYLRTNVHLTTSGQFRSAALRNAVAEVGHDRVLFSIDYPFEDTSEAVTWFRSTDINDTERSQIGFANAARLLRLAPTVAT